MTRNNFRQNIPYAAQLLRVTKRPLENGDEAKIYLLRLEFEIFQIAKDTRLLHAMDCVASRDIVVGSGLPPVRAGRVLEYARLLKIKNIHDVAEWTELGRVSSRAWVAVTFGPTDETDFRNSFHSVQSFDSRNYEIRTRSTTRPTDWTTVSTAARELQTSCSTLRRRLPALEKTAPMKLVRKTNGGHRRINLPLLRNMWTETVH